MKVRVRLSDDGEVYLVEKKKLFGWTQVAHYNIRYTENAEQSAIEYAKRLLEPTVVFEER